MAVINTTQDVNDVVYHMTEVDGVRRGIVKSIDIAIRPTGTTVEYSIQFVDSTQGSVTAVEAEIFGDVDTALAAYKVLVEA